MAFFKNGKEKLMELLDDPDVQRKISRIASPRQNFSVDSGQSSLGENENTFSNARENDAAAQAERERMRDELTLARKDLKAAQEKAWLAQKEAGTLNAQVKDLQSKNANLTEQLTSVRRDHEDAQAKCKQLSSQNSNMRADLDNVRGTLQQHESSMAEFNQVFDLYNDLPNRVKDGLQGIFNGSSLRAFIICGVQKDNLFTLWDYCKTEFDRGKMEAHDALLAIFEFFFGLVKQSVSGTFLYEIQAVAIGDAFNKDLHTVAGMGVASGKINRVILPGIVYATNQKIFKKSLVEVR